MPTAPISSIDVVDGSLVVTGLTGVSRLPGGLPTAQDTTTPPQEFIAAPNALDAVFLDTDTVAGADTAYVVRDGRGVWKFILDAGTWKGRGSVGGSYGYVAARAVAGAVEVYLTTSNTAKLVKFVDTAESGAEVKTTGVSTLAYAPARARYAGLAFTPDRRPPGRQHAVPGDGAGDHRVVRGRRHADRRDDQGQCHARGLRPELDRHHGHGRVRQPGDPAQRQDHDQRHGRGAHGDVRSDRDRHHERRLHGALRR